jgi:CubicO group peptidase (beta-lactamase class C family)
MWSTIPAAVRADTLDAQAVDALAQQALEAIKIPGLAIAIVRGNDVVYLKGFGVRALGSNEPVTPETVFAIGSTTKAFTTTAMAMMVDEGKMTWDDPVRQHIPFFRLADPLADESVTLRDLVAHRTGLARRHDLLWYGAPWGREEILRRVGKLKLDHPFRTRYDYANMMYLAAGYAAGRAAECTWDELIQRRLFEPLGMTGATCICQDAQNAPDHATPHRKQSGKVRSIPWRNIENIGPAGSINAGVSDMSKWVRFQLGDGTWEGKKLVSAKNLAETHTPQMVMPLGVETQIVYPETAQMSYGMGWVIQDYRGQKLVWHDGGIDGFSAYVALVPRARLGIVILANLDGAQLVENALSNSIIDLALDLPKRPWIGAFAFLQNADSWAAPFIPSTEGGDRQEGTKPSHGLTAYVGAYEEPAYGKVELSLENDALVLNWSSYRLKLEHFHYDTFTGKAGQDKDTNPLDDQKVVFQLGADGDVASLKFLGQEFKKGPPPK